MISHLLLTCLVLCLSSSVGFAQAPRCQCVPEKFVITENSLVVAVQPNSKVVSYAEETRLAFDSMSQMSGMFIKFTFFDGRPAYPYRVITDYTKKAQWLIDPQKQTCEKNRYTTRIQRCLSNNSTYTGSFHIGTKDVYTDQWTFNVSESGTYGFETFSFLQDSCVPFSQAFVGQSEGEQVTVASGYVDYENGISDPDMFFRLPYFCPLATNHTRKNNRTSRIFELFAFHQYIPLPGHLFL